jgi:hypothetical protein
MGYRGIVPSSIRVFFLSIFLLAFLWAPAARGAELSNYPGWFLDKIAQENEEGVISGGPEFYSLKPSDGRAAITVSAGTAAKLKAGQLEPDSIYNKSEKENTASMGSDENVYGSKALVQGVPLYFTALFAQQPSHYK